MAAVKTNERPGTRAVLKSYRASAYKFREVLDLIRGRDVKTAREILAGVERDVAQVVGKLLDSAIANAVHNDSIPSEELFVAACFADEGPTMKRFRARARGRAGAIRKRTAHVTVIVSRMDESQLKVVRSKRDTEEANRRARRVARTRGSSNAASKGTDPKSVNTDIVSEDVVTSDVIDEVTTLSPESEVIESEATISDASEIVGGADVEPSEVELADEASVVEASEEEEK